MPPSKRTLRKRAWLKENPVHRLARTAVKNALQRNKMVKGPCYICGNDQVEAHHESYYPEKRLEVTRLCKAHHRAWHKLFIAEYPDGR